MTSAMPVGPRPRTISCEGALGRRGHTTVVVRDGRVILTVPPGESAKYTDRELSELRAVLEAAQLELRRIES